MLLVKGGVPGAIGGWVSITDAKKKTLPPHAPYPIGSKIIKKNENKIQEVKKNKDTNDSLSAEKKIVEKVVDDKSEEGSNGK